jgi:inorganic triphosphatase YgiF
VAHNGSEIELSLDEGRVAAAGRSLPVHEIELELRRGKPPQLFRLARQLARHGRATLAVRSKADRGYELLTGRAAQPVKAFSAWLSPDMRASDAFQAIARACLHQLLFNLPALRASNAEGLHQARVALRRLRTAISLFSELLRDAQSTEIKTNLKWLTGEFGAARSLDVFVGRVVEPVVGRQHREDGFDELKAHIDDDRTHAFERARSAIETVRFRALVLDVAAWIELGDWKAGTDDLKRALSNRSICRTATEQLEARHRRIVKRGKHLGALSPRRRHKLRIAVKKLRYAIEFFAPLFPAKKERLRRRAFAAALKELQDCLGDLNDIMAHERLSRELVNRHLRGPQRRGQIWGVFAAGELCGQEQARCGSVLKSAIAAYEQFANAKRCWPKFGG